MAIILNFEAFQYDIRVSIMSSQKKKSKGDNVFQALDILIFTGFFIYLYTVWEEVLRNRKSEAMVKSKIKPQKCVKSEV
jgi:CRISPR/Cas system-associated protein endoribonuclease Cas2